MRKRIWLAVGLFTTPVLGEAPYMPPPADGDVRIMYVPGFYVDDPSELFEWTTRELTIDGKQYWSYEPFGNIRLDPEGNVWVRWPAEDEARAFNAAFLQTISEHPVLQEAQQATAYKYVDASSADLLYFEFTRPQRPEQFELGCYPWDEVDLSVDELKGHQDAIDFLDFLYVEGFWDLTSFSIRGWPYDRVYEGEALFVQSWCAGEQWEVANTFRRGLGLYRVSWDTTLGSRGWTVIGARLDGVEWGDLRGDLTAVSPMSWGSVKACFTCPSPGADTSQYSPQQSLQRRGSMEAWSNGGLE